MRLVSLGASLTAVQQSTHDLLQHVSSTRRGASRLSAHAHRPITVGRVILALFRRRLRDGATFDDFISAWEADKGFGVPARVFNAISLDDPREILSVGFVDIAAGDLEAAAANVSDQEAVRHSRIDDVIESTILRGYYDLRSEHDFSSDPRRVEIGSVASLLSMLTPGARD